MLKFEVTLEEANLIIKGLSELPLKVSLDLVNKLQTQAKNQLEKSEPKAE